MAIRHVWEKYNVVGVYSWQPTEYVRYTFANVGTTAKTLIPASAMNTRAAQYMYQGTGYTINSDHTFTLTGVTNTNGTFLQYNGSSFNDRLVSGAYYMAGNGKSVSNFPYIFQGVATQIQVRFWSKTKGIEICFNSACKSTDYVVAYKVSQVQTGTEKGTTSYGTVTSNSSNAYPLNGESGNYWYVYKGTESVNYAAVDGVVKELKTAVCVDGAIKTDVSIYQCVNGAIKQS